MTNYTLEGYGSTIKEAGEDLSKKEAGLLGRLSNVGRGGPVSDRAQTVFVASYVGKSDKYDELKCPEFKIRVSDPDEIQREAKKRANGGSLSSYDIAFTVKRDYDLDSAQLETAIGRREESPTASIQVGKRDPLADLLIR